MDEVSDQTVVTNIRGLDKTKEKQAYVIFLSGPLVGKIHLLEEGAVTFGRGDDVSIPINDLGISRHHASIEFKNGRAVLKDLGSTNGTFLNGQHIEGTNLLADGDKIQISSSTILKYAYQDKIENIFHNELYKMAVVDALTGAYNRRYFEERIKEEFSYCLRNHVPLSLLMFDIDHFKSINDTYGHPAGDYVLSHVVTLTRSIVRGEDLLARFGGEEFMIVLKATDGDGALMLAERLRRLVDESHFEFDAHKIHVTISVGIATLSGHNLKDWEQMVHQADDLMYTSKKSGRNRVSTI